MPDVDTFISTWINSRDFIVGDAKNDQELSVDIPALIEMFKKTNDRTFYAFGGGGGGFGLGGSSTSCCATGTCD